MSRPNKIGYFCGLVVSSCVVLLFVCSVWLRDVDQAPSIPLRLKLLSRRYTGSGGSDGIAVGSQVVGAGRSSDRARTYDDQNLTAVGAAAATSSQTGSRVRTHDHDNKTIVDDASSWGYHFTAKSYHHRMTGKGTAARVVARRQRHKVNASRVEVTRNIRNTTTHALCAVEELNHISRLNSEQRKTLDAQILVDDAHGFMYCFVPKVACSNWKRVIKYMNGKVPDLETPMKMDHHKDLVFLNDFNDAEVDYRLKNYFKFMFVRDPTERLLSAYRNKFGENIGTYNMKYGPKIIQKYRRPGERIEGDDQTRITFEEFLRFLVDSDTRRMDPHWRPMWELCQPCAVKYDFIGSFEQLQEDATHVLERVRGDSDAYFPKRQSWYKPTTDDKISKELNRVQPKYMKQVVDKYARDYMLFGYNPPVSEVSRPKL